MVAFVPLRLASVMVTCRELCDPAVWPVAPARVCEQHIVVWLRRAVHHLFRDVAADTLDGPRGLRPRPASNLPARVKNFPASTLNSRLSRAKLPASRRLIRALKLVRNCGRREAIGGQPLCIQNPPVTCRGCPPMIVVSETSSELLE